MHDDLPQRRRAHERGDCPEQLACGERGHGAAILDDMAQLVFEQHGVCRHHDRIRAQDREIRGDELRTVLAEDHDAVAALHAAHVLEIAGQPLHLVQQLAVRDRAAVKVDDDLLRKAPRRDFQVFEQRRLGHVKALRHAALRVAALDRERASGPIHDALGRIVLNHVVLLMKRRSLGCWA